MCLPSVAARALWSWLRTVGACVVEIRWKSVKRNDDFNPINANNMDGCCNCIVVQEVFKLINNNGKVRMATLGLYGQGSSQSDRRWTGALLLMKFGKVRLRACVALKWMIGNCWGNCPAIRVCSFYTFPLYQLALILYVYIAVDTVVWM